MEIRVPSFDELIWPTIVALRQLGGSASIGELLALVIDNEGIAPDTASIPHTDGLQSRLAYNMGRARSYLRRVGALESSPRGVWSLTDRGHAMTEDDARRVPDVILDRGDIRPSIATAESPPCRHGETEEAWKIGLLTTARGMHPDAFERLTQRLLREAGFSRVEVTGRRGDGGIDGTGTLRVNLLSFQVLFQCKRYTGTVGSPEIRDFRGAMRGRCDKGLFITTGSFSIEAQREASRDGAPAIDLIDGDQLCDLLKRYKLGVETKQVEEVSVDADWFGRI